MTADNKSESATPITQMTIVLDDDRLTEKGAA